ncbi:MAG: M20 family metallopeptidase [Anaerolineae bacterium]|jgi:amidohydrolase
MAGEMLQRARTLQEDLIAWRRDLHRHPELGFRETRTAGLVAGVLESLGYRVRTGVGRTGVVGDRGTGTPIVAVRADMDALPIQEENEVAYASQVPGVMHACGHDAHTSIGLGVATLLSRESFPGTIRFLFQPSEEGQDDQGYSGARRMVQEGAMDGVDAVLALHVHAGTPVGTITVDAGPTSAGVDSFRATIAGRGSHGAYPHKGLDPVHTAAHVILALHGIVSRRLDPFAPAVVTVGSIHGGQAGNIIPEKVELAGTIRYQDPAVQSLLHDEIERAVAVARTLGGDYRLHIRAGAGPVINDESMVALVREVAAEMLGADNVWPREKGMGAEDFSAMADLAPGVMFRLGCELEGQPRTAHNPTFDLDEGCLPIGAAILAEAALRRLRRPTDSVS